MGLEKYYGKNATKRGNPKDAPKKDSQAAPYPREIDRIDAPESTVPGSQWYAHGKEKNDGTINLDGTIHDSNPKL